MIQYQVFISYRRLRTSSEIAEKLFTSLESEGYSVFFDRTTLDAGDRFKKRICEAIDSCKIFIVILSKETLEEDSKWVPRETKRALSRTKDDSIYIIPIICDESVEKDYYPRLFRKKDIDGDISFYKYDGNFDELNKAVIKAIESRQVYPPENTSDSIKRIQRARDSIKSLPELLSGVITECKNCPRFSSTDGQIRCPFLFPDASSDEAFFDSQATLRVPVKQRPNEYDYSPFSEPKDVSTLWFEAREAIKNEFRIKVRDGHVGCSRNEACEHQRNALMRLQKLLSALNEPLYQTNLYELSKRIDSLSNRISNGESQILKQFNINELLCFVSSQIQRCWYAKEWSINYLVKRNGFDTLESLISNYLHESAVLLEHAVQENKQIDTIKPFLILWWLLRKNSSILTKAILSKSSPKAKERLVQAIGHFLSAYNECDDRVQFKHALQLHKIDFPEEMQSTLTASLCLPTTDYRWINIKDKSNPYFSSAKLDNYKNPIYTDSLYLAKCVNEFEMDNIFIYSSDDDYSSVGYDSHNVYAIDYLYPLSEYCLQLKTALYGKETYEINLCSPSPKIISLLDTDNFNVELLNYSPEVFDSDFLTYTTAAFDHKADEWNLDNRKKIVKREGNNSILSVEDVLNSKDLSLIIYIADIFAFSDTPDYENAIRLYENAISMGACFCMYRIAQCYEIRHDYRLALWWYMTVDEESVEDKDTLYLRMGTCCYHLNEMALCNDFYDKAGAKGQAAKYKYKLYSDNWPFDYNKDKVFNEAMSNLLDVVKPRLGLFDDLHDFQIVSKDETIDLALKTVDDLRKKALKDNDPTAQYKLGLYDLEAFISSDIFVEKALKRIKLAGNNGSPHALCFIGLYMERFKHNPSAANHYYNAALNAVFPNPFPDISKMER